MTKPPQLVDGSVALPSYAALPDPASQPLKAPDYCFAGATRAAPRKRARGAWLTQVVAVVTGGAALSNVISLTG